MRPTAGLAALFLALAAPSWAKTVPITVYHTNDIHGWIMAHSDPRDPARVSGGAAALARYYRAQPGPKLLLDAGDWFQGTPEGTLSRGQALVDVFNALPYDAVAVGNHEFDFGEENLQGLVRGLRVPALSANVYRGGKRVGYLKPWIVKEVSGIKVGLFGLLTSRMSGRTFAKNIAGLEFRREVDEARAAVKALRALGATVIIAVTHVGLEEPGGSVFEGDKTLATEVAGIDLIVGGHSHIPLHSPIRDASHGTLIAQAGTGLFYVGRAVLDVDAQTKKVVSATASLESLSTALHGQDPELAALVGRHAHSVGAAFDLVLASAPGGLPHDPRAAGESVLGDWITDCARARARTDLAFLNTRGIRAPLPAGPVTLRALFNIMPFEDRFVRLELDGRTVREILERGVGGAPGMLQVSGLEFSYNARRPRGRRVGAVRAGGRALEPAARYTAVAPSFMVQGGDGYNAFERARDRAETGALIRDELKACAESQGIVVAPAFGRIKVE